MTRKTRKPAPFGVGRVRVRPIRGPDEADRWYWRAELTEEGCKRTIWTGWGSEEEAVRALAAIVAEGRTEPAARSEAETVRDLLEFWLGSFESREDLCSRTIGLARQQAGIGF